MEMIKKQTAVEWLVNHWKKLQSEGEKMSWQQIIDITELAKEMEKQQIVNAYNQGVTDEYGETLDFTNDTDAEEYYNKNYGQ